MALSVEKILNLPMKAAKELRSSDRQIGAVTSWGNMRRSHHARPKRTLTYVAYRRKNGERFTVIRRPKYARPEYSTEQQAILEAMLSMGALRKGVTTGDVAAYTGLTVNGVGQRLAYMPVEVYRVGHGKRGQGQQWKLATFMADVIAGF
jgi:hypothetical protein